MAKSNLPSAQPKGEGDHQSSPSESESGPEEKRTELRRESDDRRAFWRPTPDRRREATERGRRSSDGDAR